MINYNKKSNGMILKRYFQIINLDTFNRPIILNDLIVINLDMFLSNAHKRLINFIDCFEVNKIIIWNNEINSYVTNEIKLDIMQKIEKNKFNIIEKNEKLLIINLINDYNFEKCHI